MEVQSMPSILALATCQVRGPAGTVLTALLACGDDGKVPVFLSRRITKSSAANTSTVRKTAIAIQTQRGNPLRASVEDEGPSLAGSMETAFSPMGEGKGRGVSYSFQGFLAGDLPFDLVGSNGEVGCFSTIIGGDE